MDIVSVWTEIAMIESIMSSELKWEMGGHEDICFMLNPHMNF